MGFPRVDGVSWYPLPCAARSGPEWGGAFLFFATAPLIARGRFFCRRAEWGGGGFFFFCIATPSTILDGLLQKNSGRGTHYWSKGAQVSRDPPRPLRKCAQFRARRPNGHTNSVRSAGVEPDSRSCHQNRPARPYVRTPTPCERTRVRITPCEHAHALRAHPRPHHALRAHPRPARPRPGPHACARSRPVRARKLPIQQMFGVRISRKINVRAENNPVCPAKTVQFCPVRSPAPDPSGDLLAITPELALRESLTAASPRSFFPAPAARQSETTGKIIIDEPISC